MKNIKEPDWLVILKYRPQLFEDLPIIQRNAFLHPFSKGPLKYNSTIFIVKMLNNSIKLHQP